MVRRVVAGRREAGQHFASTDSQPRTRTYAAAAARASDLFGESKLRDLTKTQMPPPVLATAASGTQLS